MSSIVVSSIKNRSGTITTPSYHVPSNLTGEFIVRTIMPASEVTKSGNRIFLDVEVSTDDVNFYPSFGFTWEADGQSCTDMQGDPLDGPGVIIDGSKLAGKYIRGKIVLAQTMQVGLRVESV